MNWEDDYQRDLAVAYGRGYKDGRSHERVYLVQSLWERANLLSKSFPELAEGIKIAAEIITEKPEAETKPKKKKLKKKS
jgi:hypothetical protein